MKHAIALAAMLTALAVVAAGPSTLLAQQQPAQPTPNQPGPNQQQTPLQPPSQTPPQPAPAPGETPAQPTPAPVVAPVTPAPGTPPAGAPTSSIEGVVAEAQLVGCGTFGAAAAAPVTPGGAPATAASAAETCQATLEVTPGISNVVRTTQADRIAFSKFNTVLVSVAPTSTLTWAGNPIMVSDLKAGDQVRIDYYTVDNANIATSVTVMARMGAP